jgi:hypothetical protein
VTEHPLLRMWKDRLEAEMARDRELAAQRVTREMERAAWYVAWRAYKAHATEAREHVPNPRWWDLLGWVRWLVRLHAPGRPG